MDISFAAYLLLPASFSIIASLHADLRISSSDDAILSLTPSTALNLLHGTITVLSRSSSGSSNNSRSRSVIAFSSMNIPAAGPTNGGRRFLSASGFVRCSFDYWKSVTLRSHSPDIRYLTVGVLSVIGWALSVRFEFHVSGSADCCCSV